MATNKIDTDSIINQLINSKGKNVKLKEKDISMLCKTAREIFMEQPVFLELEAPIKICGKFIISDFIPAQGSSILFEREKNQTLSYMSHDN